MEQPSLDVVQPLSEVPPPPIHEPLSTAASSQEPEPLSAAPSAVPDVFSMAEESASPLEQFSMAEESASPLEQFSMAEESASPLEQFSMAEESDSPPEPFSMGEETSSPLESFSMEEESSSPSETRSPFEQPPVDVSSPTLEQPLPVEQATTLANPPLSREKQPVAAKKKAQEKPTSKLKNPWMGKIKMLFKGRGKTTGSGLQHLQARVTNLFKGKGRFSDDQVGLFWGRDWISMVGVTGLASGDIQLKLALHETFAQPEDRSKRLFELGVTHQIQKTPLHLALGTEQYDLFPQEAVDVPQEEMAMAMRWLVRNRLDYPVEEAVVDCFEIPEAGGQSAAAATKKVYVVAAQREVVKKCVDALQPPRLNLQSIEILELALNNVAARLPESEEGVALLYLPPGEETGILLVSRQGMLHLVRQVGGVSDDAMDLGIDPGDALGGESQRSLDYYQNHFAKPPVAALYLITSPENETRLAPALSHHLKVRVKNFELSTLLKVDLELAPELHAYLFPALGAALRSTG
ncbi:MAG: hypothetical protein HQL52_04830 [Magnetococcales bacterium]|nr:hypothetical protein [Magnetococcales bacterium]